MNETILIADDETQLTALVALYLENEGYRVIQCHNAAEALHFVRTTHLDLVLLDVMLPDENGFSVCRKIRQQHRYPVILLTACTAQSDKITGLSLGSDDYITKPFLPLEMVARVKAQLRRYICYNEGASPGHQVFQCGGLVLDDTGHTCTMNGRLLYLTPTEFIILRTLFQHMGSVVSAEQLFHAVWGKEYFSRETNTIPVHIRHLRRKMGDSCDHPKYIRTVWGHGYKLEE